jgi:hypothetical protein
MNGVVLKIRYIGDMLELKFRNNTNHVIQIPNLLLRNIVENEYVVMSPKYMYKDADTLIIKLTNKRDSTAVNLEIVPVPSKETKVEIYYTDIKLKKKSIQKIRLPQKYRGEIYKYGIIILDEKMIAKAKIE